MPVYIEAINCVTPLGWNIAENWNNILSGHSGIVQQNFGAFHGIYCSAIQEAFMGKKDYSFLETLILEAALPVVSGKTITDRTGFILSTTKGNIDFLEIGNAQKVELFPIAKKIADEIGIKTKPIVVSHACVSGLLAVMAAKRFIQMGKFDTVLVVAGDQLSQFVTSGFNAFQAMSDQPCRPFDKNRNGVSLGEATAAVWVTKDVDQGLVEILGESGINDANHISGPSRTGEGLFRSVQNAFEEASITTSEIDFISAHGTATVFNDEMEAVSFERAGLIEIPVNSLKGYYGHTLGASGLLEFVISIKSLLENTLVPTIGYAENGTSKDIRVITALREMPLFTFLKTASGFGGSNAALIARKVIHG